MLKIPTKFVSISVFFMDISHDDINSGKNRLSVVSCRTALIGWQSYVVVSVCALIGSDCSVVTYTFVSGSDCSVVTYELA